MISPIITGKSIVTTLDLIKVGRALYEHDRKQVSDHFKLIKSAVVPPMNRQLEKSPVSLPKKEEVLEKPQTSDPDAFTKPTSSIAPHTPEKAIKEEQEEPVQIRRDPMRSYTQEELDILLALLDSP